MNRRVYLNHAAWMTPRFPDGDIDMLCAKGGLPCLSVRAPRTFSEQSYERWREQYQLPSHVRDLALACEIVSRLPSDYGDATHGSKPHLVFAVQESRLLERLICHGEDTSTAAWADPETAAEVLGRLAGATSCTSVNAACATGNYAIGLAADSVACGDTDSAVVCIACSLFDCADEAFRRMELAAHEYCVPCHPARTGTLVSEGAAALLVSSEASDTSVEIAGYGFSADAYNQVALEPQGQWLEAAMRDALAMAGLHPADVDYVNLHGTGTVANDAIEISALRRLTGIRATIGSTKAYTGHCLLAASAVEAAICHQLLLSGRLPQDIYLKGQHQEAGPDFRIDDVPSAAARVAMSNSFGFGGANSAVIFVKST